MHITSSTKLPSYDSFLYHHSLYCVYIENRLIRLRATQSYMSIYAYVKNICSVHISSIYLRVKLYSTFQNDSTENRHRKKYLCRYLNIIYNVSQNKIYLVSIKYVCLGLENAPFNFILKHKNFTTTTTPSSSFLCASIFSPQHFFTVGFTASNLPN